MAQQKVVPTNTLKLVTAINNHKVAFLSSVRIQEDLSRAVLLILTVFVFQKFMDGIDNKKPIILSLNLLSKAFLGQDSPEANELRERLNHTNNRFEALNSRAADWMERLRRALRNASALLAAIRDLQLKTDSAESKLRSIQPVDLDASKESLGAQYNRLKTLRTEVEALLDEHAGLQQAAAHVEAAGGAREAAAAKQRLAELEDRLDALLAATLLSMSLIEDRLDIQRDDSVSLPPLFSYWCLQKTSVRSCGRTHLKLSDLNLVFLGSKIPRKTFQNSKGGKYKQKRVDILSNVRFMEHECSQSCNASN